MKTYIVKIREVCHKEYFIESEEPITDENAFEAIDGLDGDEYYYQNEIVDITKQDGV